MRRDKEKSPVGVEPLGIKSWHLTQKKENQEKIGLLRVTCPKFLGGKGVFVRGKAELRARKGRGRKNKRKTGRST